MSNDREPTRRAFLKGGAVLAAPLALATPAAAIAADDRAGRLRRLEDEAAIRALHQDWLRRVNGGDDAAGLFVDARAARCLDAAVCGLTGDPAAMADTVEIAPDGRHANGRFLCILETERRVAPDSTLAQMALAQGGGVVRERARRLVSAAYVKAGDRWTIARVTLREA